LGLVGAVIAWGVSVLFVSTITVWWALKSNHFQITWDITLMRQMVRFGIKLYPGNLMQFLNYRLDVFLISLFLGPSEVGLYITATTLAERLWDIPHALRTVLLQRVAANPEMEATKALTAQVSRITLSIMALLSLMLALATYPLIDFLYGQAFLASVPALILLLPGITVLSVGKLLSAFLSGIGHPEAGTYGAAGALLSTLILDILLIPIWSFYGAALASSISYILSAIIIFVLFLHYSHVPVTVVWFTSLVTEETPRYVDMNEVRLRS
jgi:O-antigen/teichoic acid export membrane protein